MKNKKQISNQTSITVSTETRNKLIELKYEWKLKSIEEVIIELISIYNKDKQKGGKK